MPLNRLALRVAELRRRRRARGHGVGRERDLRDRRAPRARAPLRVDAHADAGVARRGLRDRGSGEPRAAADARHRLDAHPRRQRDSPDRGLEAVARGSRRPRRARLRYDVRAGHRARQMDLVARRAASASSFAARSAPRPSASSKSCRRRCASSPAATTACAATRSRSSAPSTRTATSSAARRSRRAASSSSSRCARAGRSPFFVDSGNAFERSEMDAKTSVGMGGRWQSPLGPIRIDLALPLERRPRRAGASTSRWGPTYEVAQARRDRSLRARGRRARGRRRPCYWALGTESGTTWLVQPARRRRAADLDRAHPRLAARRLAPRGRAHAHDARRARHRLARRSSGTAPALLTGVLAFDARRRDARDVSPRARRRRERRRPARSCRGLCASTRQASRRCRSRSPTARCCSTSTTFAGTYGGGRLELSDVARTFGDAALAARRARSSSRDGIELDVAGEWSAPLAGVAASGSVELTGHMARAARSARARGAVRGDDDGHARGGPFRVDVVNEWQNLAWPERRRSRERERPARARRLAGRLSLRRRRRGRHRRAAPPASRSKARASASCSQLARLELTTRGAAAAARCAPPAAVDLESRETSLDVAANGFDPAWLVAAWPGRLDGTTRLRAGLAPEPNAALDAIELARRAARLSRHARRRGRTHGPRPRSARRAAPRLRLESRRADGRARPRERSTSSSTRSSTELDLLVPDVGRRVDGGR